MTATTAPKNETIVWLLVVIGIFIVVMFTMTLTTIYLLRLCRRVPVLRQSDRWTGGHSTAPQAPRQLIIRDRGAPPPRQPRIVYEQQVVTRETEMGGGMASQAARSPRGYAGQSRKDYFRR